MADTPVATASSSSSGMGFFSGLALGVLVGGGLAALLYVGLQDENRRKQVVSQRYETIAKRRRAGYAY